MKFYICKTCGKIIAIVKDAPAPTMCCGQKMEEIVPGTTDAAVEKHVPVFEIKDRDHPKYCVNLRYGVE